MAGGPHALAFSDDEGVTWQTVTESLAHHWGDVVFDALGQRWALRTSGNGTTALVHVGEAGALTSYAVAGLSAHGTVAAGLDGHLWLAAEPSPCVFEIVRWFEGEELSRTSVFASSTSYCADRVALVVDEDHSVAAVDAALVSGTLDSTDTEVLLESAALDGRAIVDLALATSGELHALVAGGPYRRISATVGTRPPDGTWSLGAGPIAAAGRLLVDGEGGVHVFGWLDGVLATRDNADGSWSRRPVVGVPRAKTLGWTDQGVLIASYGGGVFLLDDSVRDVTPPDTSTVIGAAWYDDGANGWAVTADRVFLREAGGWAELNEPWLNTCPGYFQNAVARDDGPLYVARRCDSGSLHLIAFRGRELLRSRADDGFGTAATLIAAPGDKVWLSTGALLDAELLVPVIAPELASPPIGPVEVSGSRAWTVANGQLLALDRGKWSPPRAAPATERLRSELRSRAAGAVVEHRPRPAHLPGRALRPHWPTLPSAGLSPKIAPTPPTRRRSRARARAHRPRHRRSRPHCPAG